MQQDSGAQQPLTLGSTETDPSQKLVVSQNQNQSQTFLQGDTNQQTEKEDTEMSQQASERLSSQTNAILQCLADTICLVGDEETDEPIADFFEGHDPHAALPPWRKYDKFFADRDKGF